MGPTAMHLPSNEDPVGCDLVALLTYAKEEGASDLHISSGLPPLLRIRGQIQRLQTDPLTRDDVCTAFYGMLTEQQRETFEREHELDMGLEIADVTRVRVNLFVQQRGEAGVFRLIPSRISTLDELAMPPVLKELAGHEKGLVVVTGPTGSGKSTTLAAMVDHVNETRTAHILTIEDPIEFLHVPKKCLVSQREVGAHTHSFAAALRAGLREDPDIILVGELRDLETMSLAISAAETGHLVFATLHTNSASKTIDRMIDVFPAGQQAQIRTMLSESLDAVIAQTLLPNKDGKGRVAALEVLIGIPALRNLIREDKTTQIQSVIQTGAQHGMQTLDQSLLELVRQGLLSRQEASARAMNPELFDIAGGGSPAPAATTPRPTRRIESPTRPGIGSR
jgi:twitching motility protein PilT